MSSLLEYLVEFSPDQLSSGQIRMQCAYPENHSPDSRTRKQMFLSPDKNAYHCFSCGAKGSLVKLLTTRFDVPYYEAAELVTVSALEEIEKDKPKFEIIHYDLTPPKKLVNRGIPVSILKEYQIGVSLDNKNTVVYPLFDDAHRKILGYLFVRYYKSLLGNARKDVSYSKGFAHREHFYLGEPGEEITLVEGPVDALKLISFGENAAAILGAMLTEEQVQKLVLSRKIVYLAFDNDKAGRVVTEVAAKLLDKHLCVYIIPYTGKDPGDITSYKLWRKFKRSAETYPEYSLRMSMVNSEEYESIQNEADKRLKHTK